MSNVSPSMTALNLYNSHVNIVTSINKKKPNTHFFALSYAESEGSKRK